MEFQSIRLYACRPTRRVRNRPIDDAKDERFVSVGALPRVRRRRRVKRRRFIGRPRANLDRLRVCKVLAILPIRLGDFGSIELRS